jgi:hypothetical protein
MSVSIKVKMSDSDEDPEITNGLKKGGFNRGLMLLIVLIVISIHHKFFSPSEKK